MGKGFAIILLIVFVVAVDTLLIVGRKRGHYSETFKNLLIPKATLEAQIECALTEYLWTAQRCREYSYLDEPAGYERLCERRDWLFERYAHLGQKRTNINLEETRQKMEIRKP